MSELFSLIPLIFSGVTGLAGLGMAGEARKRTEEATRPGGPLGPLLPGTYDFSGMPGLDSPAGQDIAALLQQHGTPLSAASAYQNDLNQRALREQRGLAEQALGQVRTGTLSKAEGKLGQLIETNPEAISQATFDRLVSQYFEQNAAAARGTGRTIDESAARQNLSPDAIAALRVGARETNEAANQAAYRNLSVQRELANKDYILQLLGLGGQVGAEYNRQVAAGLSDVAGTIQPPDVVSPFAAIQQAAMTSLGLNNEQSAAFANLLMELSGSALNFAGGERNAQRMSQLGQPNTLAGPLIGGGLGAAGTIVAATIIVAGICIDASAELETQDGPKTLKQVHVGDLVKNARGEFRLVVAKHTGHYRGLSPFGMIRRPYRRSLVASGDHVIEDVRADQWASWIVCPVVEAGDLLLDDGSEYIANGYRVRSLIRPTDIPALHVFEPHNMVGVL